MLIYTERKMKVTIKKEEMRGLKYFLVYYYLPQKEGSPKKISHRFPTSDPKAESKAKKLKKEIERQVGLLGTSGILPPSAYKDYIAARALLLNHDASLVDAVDFYVKHHSRDQSRMLVRDAVEGYMDEERARNVSRGTLSGYETQTKALTKQFGGRVVSTLTGDDIVSWILGDNRTDHCMELPRYRGEVGTVLHQQEGYQEVSISDADKKRMPKKTKVSIPVTWRRRARLYSNQCPCSIRVGLL